VFSTGSSTARFVLLALALPLSAPVALCQVNVLTYQYDNTRAGANLSETTLNKTNVNAAGFGKLFAYPVDGYIYGQPLYVANITVPGRGTHNVVYVATEHDSVYAFDADSGAGANSTPLWHVSFLDTANAVGAVPADDTRCGQITPEIGITSTPVIDLAGGTIFVVAMTRETRGSSVSYVHRLHALDLAGGTEKPGSPVTIQATYPGTGEGGTTLTFNSRNYKQRPGLLLLGGTVYTAWSSHCDIGAYHGWLVGYDADSLQQVAVYNDTPNGNEGSFWAGGAAPAADSAGNIYLVSGNGTFDASGNGPDLGESYVKLSSVGGLSVLDYFTPFNYDALNAQDVDTGSAGVALIGDEAGSAAHPHLMAGAGKEGRIYLLDRDSPGKLHPGSDSQIVQSIPNAVGGLFGNPAYFNQALYFCGSGDNLTAFPISNAQMAESPGSRSGEAFGYPGCVPTISANGQANGIVWIIDPAGVLRAYDASDLANELYNSSQNAGRDALGVAVKFAPPVVANGKVYAGTQNSLAVYGLLSPGGSAVSVANAASGDSSGVAPGSIVAIYGAGLATSTATASSFPIPATLGDAGVTVNGIAAPILYASPTQINAQIPFEVSAGAASVSVSVNGAVAMTSSINVRPVAPGLFVQPQGNAAVVNDDGQVNSAARPAAVGSVISGYLTGLGTVSPPVATGDAASAGSLSMVEGGVSATIGSTPATVQFAGLTPGFAGLYQVNILIPQLPAGQYPLQASVDGVLSNAAPINIQ
jgi:uncharacterized protein (TIGR03437 family)